MRKKTIAILFGLGFGISILAGIMIGAGAATIAAAATSCEASTTYCDPATTTGGLSIVILLGSLIAIAGSVLTMISWIAVLIKQAQRQQWAWFICTLLFSGICMLLWLIIEPEVPAAPQYVAMYQPGQPVYPPDGPYAHYPTDGPSYPPAPQAPYYQEPYRPQ